MELFSCQVLHKRILYQYSEKFYFVCKINGALKRVSRKLKNSALLFSERRNNVRKWLQQYKNLSQSNWLCLRPPHSLIQLFTPPNSD